MIWKAGLLFMAEITRDDLFGRSIIEFVQKFKIQKVLEIGSWDGTGSTSCFIEAMLPFDDKSLSCLEINKDRFVDLVKNTKKHEWIKCYNESSISYKSLLYKDFDNIWDSPFNGLPREYNPKHIVKGWFEDDVIKLKQVDAGFLERDNSFFDGVLIDGSEFTGLSEFELLKNRVNYLFLDDVFHAFKTREVADILLRDSGWECLGYSQNTRNGFMIFKRKNLINA